MDEVFDDTDFVAGLLESVDQDLAPAPDKKMEEEDPKKKKDKE